MKLKDLPGIVDNSTLLTIFVMAIRRAAIAIVIDQQRTEGQSAWAKRACYTFRDDRSAFYARLVIEGALVENPQFRDAAEAALADPGNIQIPDAALAALVGVWVGRFVALEI